MNRAKILQILTKKLKNNEIAHLYFIDANNEDENKSFVSSLISSNFDNFTYEHADVLEIKTENKTYKVEDLEPAFKFSYNSPWEWHKKFIYISEGEKLSEIVVNKLLKILEEPPKYLTIFISRRRHFEFIPTLESRGLKIQLPIENSVDSTKPEVTFDLDSLSSFLSQTKGQKEVSEFLQSLLQTRSIDKILSASNNQYSTHEDLLNILQHIQNNAVYNGQLYPEKTDLFKLLKLNS